MRVLFINTKKGSAYSRYVLALIQEFVSEKNDVIRHNAAVTSSGEAKDSNETKVIIKTIGSNVFPFFQNLSLYFFIKKQKVQWLVQAAGKPLFSSRLLTFIIPVDSKNFVIKKPLSSSIKIMVGSQPERDILLAAYPFIKNNFLWLPASAKANWKPVSWSEKQAIKMQHTQGKEYFMADVTNGSEAVFTSLLKAFSLFKKWQHSSMKLVVAGSRFFAQTKEGKEKLNSYKYRDDVVMKEDFLNTESRSLLAGAYAFIHTPTDENDVVPLLQSLQCETPCLSFFTDTLKAYAGDTALLSERNNFEQLSDNMILIYKDETLRSRLIEEGKKKAQQYARAEAMQALAAVLPTGID